MKQHWPDSGPRLGVQFLSGLMSGLGLGLGQVFNWVSDQVLTQDMQGIDTLSFWSQVRSRFRVRVRYSISRKVEITNLIQVHRNLTMHRAIATRKYATQALYTCTSVVLNSVRFLNVHVHVRLKNFVLDVTFQRTQGHQSANHSAREPLVNGILFHIFAWVTIPLYL